VFRALSALQDFNDSPLATCTRKETYSGLPDPTAQSSQGSTSLAVTKANGDEVGHVLYDGYGAVLTSTLPATLTTILAGSGDVPDPDTGLVYLGAGRHYDPALGRPLQPDPIGGPPTVPQALNRYAATPWGPPGVVEGADANSFLISWSRDNWYRQASSGLVACATCVLKEIKTTEPLFRPHYTVGEKSWSTAGLFRQVGRDLYQSLDDGTIYTTDDLLFGTFLATDLDVRWTGSRLVDNALKKLLLRSGGRLALNLGVAVVLDVGFEVLEATSGTGRWANPYWTTEQKLIQARTAILGDLAIVAAVTWWNPELWIAIPVYFVASMSWNAVHPIMFPSQFEENRNLAPLVQ
jgi:RHS repeat-associated protein